MTNAQAFILALSIMILGHDIYVGCGKIAKALEKK